MRGLKYIIRDYLQDKGREAHVSIQHKQSCEPHYVRVHSYNCTALVVTPSDSNIVSVRLVRRGKTRNIDLYKHGNQHNPTRTPRYLDIADPDFFQKLDIALRAVGCPPL